MSVLVVLLALVCLAMAAWLRAAGTAVTRIPRADALRDSAEHVSGAATVAELLEDRELITPAAGAPGPRQSPTTRRGCWRWLSVSEAGPMTSSPSRSRWSRAGNRPRPRR